MKIVLIRWRIKPTAEAEFLIYWETQARVQDKSGLIGEFLSRVDDGPEGGFPFKVDDLSTSASTDCIHYVNVGLWQNWEAFYQQVGQYMRDDRDPLAFEAERRTRTVLDPATYRIGKSLLPMTGSCE